MAELVLNIPESWEEITLETYSEIQREYSENGKITPIKLLSILGNIEEKELEQYPMELIERVFSHLTFLNEKIDDSPSNEIVIDGETYKVNTEEQLRFKEYVDFNNVVDEDKFNYATMLAILCRKKGEIYNDDFIANELPNRIELFKKQKVCNILKIINFFLHSNLHSIRTLKAFTKEAAGAADQQLMRLESLAKNGDGKKHFTNSQMKELRILRKQVNSILQQC